MLPPRAAGQAPGSAAGRAVSGTVMPWACPGPLTLVIRKVIRKPPTGPPAVVSFHSLMCTCFLLSSLKTTGVTPKQPRRAAAHVVEAPAVRFPAAVHTESALLVFLIRKSTQTHHHKCSDAVRSSFPPTPDSRSSPSFSAHQTLMAPHLDSDPPPPHPCSTVAPGDCPSSCSGTFCNSSGLPQRESPQSWDLHSTPHHVGAQTSWWVGLDHAVHCSRAHTEAKVTHCPNPGQRRRARTPLPRGP